MFCVTLYPAAFFFPLSHSWVLLHHDYTDSCSLINCALVRSNNKKTKTKITESSGPKAPYPQLWFKALFSSGSSGCSFLFHFSSEKESLLRSTLLTQGDGVHYEDARLSFDRDVSDSSPVWPSLLRCKCVVFNPVSDESRLKKHKHIYSLWLYILGLSRLIVAWG